MLDDGGDDEDGSLDPPPPASTLACGGGYHTTNHQLGVEAVPIKLWSREEDPRSGVGFTCAHDVANATLFAKLESKESGDDDALSSATERSMKGAIATLLDVAEALNSRKITLGLSPDHAGCTELVCSLLYLGFQVIPASKSPLVNTALLLDFDIGFPTGGPFSSGLCTGTSDCSTSADDDGLLDSESPCDSD
jgi:hypothetical protein